ncbi:MAG: tetratricopeptide repeat protein [Candidatus Rifleibacteriota bacterium]
MFRFLSIFILFFQMISLTAEARVLSGSRTERKMNKKIERLLNSARKQYDSQKVQQALDTYWKILELDPQETFAYLELGEIYHELKIYDRAIELLEPGTKSAELEMDPETVCHYYCVLTRSYMELNQLGLASKALIKAAEASPKNPLPRKILGDIYLANNRIKSAYKAYKKALTFDPDYQPALEKIGELTTKYGLQLSAKTEESPVKKQPAKEKTVVRPVPQPVKEPEPSEDSSQDQDLKEVASSDNDDEAASSDENELIALPAAVKPAQTGTPRPKPLPAAVKKEEKQKVAAVTPTNVEKPAEQAKPADSGKKVEDQTASPAASIAKPDQAVVEEQIDKLLAGSPEDKSAAVNFFVSLENDGIVEVEELLYDSDPEVRIVAIRALGAFKKHKAKVSAILQDSQDDPDPEVKKEIENVLNSL